MTRSYDAMLALAALVLMGTSLAARPVISLKKLQRKGRIALSC